MEKFAPYFWILFSIFSFVHLIFCFQENEKARKISKCFIMPLLITYLVMMSCNKINIYLGAIFGFLGDVFIIFKKNKVFFILGAVFFMLGHVFYILEMYTILGGFEYWHIFIFGLIFFVLFIIGKNLVYPKVGKLCYVGIVYFTFLSSMLFVAIFTRDPLIIIATFTFIVSDVILSFVNFFKKDVNKKELYVMSTYILAQTLMILALI